MIIPLTWHICLCVCVCRYLFNPTFMTHNRHSAIIINLIFLSFNFSGPLEPREHVRTFSNAPAALLCAFLNLEVVWTVWRHGSFPSLSSLCLALFPTDRKKSNLQVSLMEREKGETKRKLHKLSLVMMRERKREYLHIHISYTLIPHWATPVYHWNKKVHD